MLKKLWSGFKKLRRALIVFVISTIAFFIFLFPLNDLGDLISTQVAKQTQNQVYFQFDGLNLGLIPLGLQMSNVFVETNHLSALKAKEVTVLPSVSGMLKGMPYGHITATDFLKGELNLIVSSASSSEKAIERTQLELAAKKLSLKELRNLLGFQFFIQGDLNVNSKAIADFAFQEQPEVDLTFGLTKFELPPTNIETGFGPFTTPELKLRQVDLKGRLKDGTFVIEKAEFGQTGDELQATVTGQIKLVLVNTGGQILPQIGSYNLDVDLRAQKSFQDKANIFFSFLQSHQKGPGQYKFKVASPQWGAPPQITTLR